MQNINNSHLKMKQVQIKDVIIRPMADGEAMPYELLLNADPSRKLIDAYLRESEVYVGVLADKIIGVYVLCQVGTKTVEIKNISVEEELQGVGIGRLMLLDAGKRAAERGFETMVIGTGNSSVGQLYLYQKMGFEISGIKFNFFADHYPAALYENGILVRHMIMLSKKLQ